jgi:Flp pilus assembly pilin Flp
MRLILHSFQYDESGESIVEYALLIACIGLAAIVAVHALGVDVYRLFAPATKTAQ